MRIPGKAGSSDWLSRLKSDDFIVSNLKVNLLESTILGLQSTWVDWLECRLKKSESTYSLLPTLFPGRCQSMWQDLWMAQRNSLHSHRVAFQQRNCSPPKLHWSRDASNSQPTFSNAEKYPSFPGNFTRLWLTTAKLSVKIALCSQQPQNYALNSLNLKTPSPRL